MRERESRLQFNPILRLAHPILQDVFRQKSGFDLYLMKNWQDIVGLEMAKISYPLRLIWPHKTQKDTNFMPATLEIACQGVAALHLPHMQKQIIERVNAFLGYYGVCKLRFKQKERAQPVSFKKMRLLTAQEQRLLQDKIAKIDNPQLRASVYSLGEYIVKSSGS